MNFKDFFSQPLKILIFFCNPHPRFPTRILGIQSTRILGTNILKDRVNVS
jgi:hypothetical protein